MPAAGHADYFRLCRWNRYARAGRGLFVRGRKQVGFANIELRKIANG